MGEGLPRQDRSIEVESRSLAGVGDSLDEAYEEHVMMPFARLKFF